MLNKGFQPLNLPAGFRPAPHQKFARPNFWIKGRHSIAVEAFNAVGFWEIVTHNFSKRPLPHSPNKKLYILL